MPRRDPHWLLRDPDLLEAVKRVAARYRPTFPDGTILAMDFQPVYEQHNFRFGVAGSALTGPTWEAALNTALTLEENGAGNYALQVWYEVRQTDQQADVNLTQSFELQTQLNGGTWFDVDDASADWVNMVADSGFADGDAISSDQLSGTGTVYVAGEAQETDDNSDSITFTTSDTSYTNLCWAVELVDANLSNTDTIAFRVVFAGGTVLDNAATATDASITWNDAPYQEVPSGFITPPKPAFMSGPVRHDGIWGSAWRIFPHFYQAPLWEVVEGRLGTNNTEAALNFELRDLGHAWVSAAGGDRLTWDYPDPNDWLDPLFLRPRPEWGVTVAALVETDDPPGMPSSTSIVQSYQGVAGSYAYRLHVETADDVTFEIDGGDQVVTAQVPLPAGRNCWIVGRWEEDGFVEVDIFALDGQPLVNTGLSSASSAGPIDYDGSVGTNYIALWGDSNSTFEAAGYAAFIFNKRLTQAELDELFRDPWAFQEEIDPPAAGTTALVRVVDEAVHIVESTLRPLGLHRVVDEVVQVVESIVRSRTMVRVVDEAQHILEGTVRALGLVRVVDEAQHILESIVRRTGLVRVVDEAVHIVEGTVNAVFGALVRVVDESVHVLEGTVRALGLTRVVSEAVHINEVLVRARNLVRTVAEAVHINEVLVRARAMVRVVSEAVHILEDTVSKLPGGLVRVVNESVHIVESTLRPRGLVRSVAEAVHIQEVVTRARAMVRTVAEAVHILEDTVTKLPGLIVRVVDEAVHILEDTTVARGLTRVVDEAVHILEAIVTRLPVALVKVVNETVQVVESTLPARAMVRVVNEAVHILEDVLNNFILPIWPTVQATGNALLEAIKGSAIVERLKGPPA